MCYCGCEYENYRGECRKPRRLPCPENDEAVDAWEREMEARAERKRDESLCKEKEA